MYDPEMDRWTILNPIPSKISGSSAASINNTIYVFGGEDITKHMIIMKNKKSKQMMGIPGTTTYCPSWIFCNIF
jgi:N-acetylneuraminic acid mutarotase